MYIVGFYLTDKKKIIKKKKKIFLGHFVFYNDLPYLYIHLLSFHSDTINHTNLWLRPFSLRGGTHLSRSNEFLSDIRVTHPDFEPLHNCLILLLYIYTVHW